MFKKRALRVLHWLPACANRIGGSSLEMGVPRLTDFMTYAPFLHQCNVDYPSLYHSLLSLTTSATIDPNA